MKFLNKYVLSAFMSMAMIVPTFAQEIINETTTTEQIQNNPPKKRIKVDGIIATVGEYTVLNSDIDMAFVELQQQGNDISNFTRCQMLGRLLEDKLYAHQALQDSTIVVSDVEINAMMEERIERMLPQVGGDIKRLVSFYNKKDEAEFRSMFFDILKNGKLTSEMQNKIIEEVEVTPEEVRTYFNSIPKDELPKFPAEMEISQIVIEPKISAEEHQRVIDRLNEIRREVLEDGASFRTRAVIYSDDRGSASNGGFYKITRKTPFVKEFKDVAFGLTEGEISKPFQTDFGWHIILLEKIKGQELELRHILIKPKVSDDMLKEAKERVELVRKRIIDGEISFVNAARTMSDDKDTKTNGGVMINPQTLDSRFVLTKIDPALYANVSNLKDNEVSVPILEEDPNGKKVYKLFTVTNRIEEHIADYAEDYSKIKEFALSEKQIKAIEKWTNEKIKETHIEINGEYRNCNFVNNWLKK